MSDSSRISISAKIREAGRHSIIYGFGSVAQSAVALILLPILTGSLSKEDFGVYSLIQVACVVFSAVFYLGMNSALPRSYFDYASEHDRRAVFSTAFWILGLGALVQISMGVIGGRFLSQALLGNDHHASAVAWALFGNALTFVNQYFLGYLRLLRKSTISVLFSLIGLVGGVGLTLLFLRLSPGDLASPFQAIAASQLAIGAIFIGLFRKQAFAFGIKREEVRKLLSYGLSAVVASFSAVLLDWSDRIIVERFTSLAEVGIYSAAFRIGTLINVVMILPFSQIWSPMMMEYRTRSNIRSLFTHIFSYFILSGAIILAAGALFIGDLIPFLVRSGANDLLVSMILLVMLGTLVYGTVNIVAAGFLYERKMAQLACIYYAIAGLKVAINFLVVPAYGIVGAAVTTTAAYLVLAAAVYLLGKRYFSFSIDWKKIGLISAISAFPVIYGIFFWHALPLSFWLRIAILVAVVVLMYVTCLSREEKMQIRKMLPGAS